MGLAFTTSLAATHIILILILRLNAFNIFIHLPSNQMHVLLRFAALERVMRRVYPRGIKILSLLRCGRPSGMSTCNHNRISHIYYCLPLIPFTFPLSVNREKADEPVVQQRINSPAELSPIPAPATTTAAQVELLPAAREHLRVVINPPGAVYGCRGSTFGSDGGGHDKS